MSSVVKKSILIQDVSRDTVHGSGVIIGNGSDVYAKEDKREYYKYHTQVEIQLYIAPIVNWCIGRIMGDFP